CGLGQASHPSLAWKISVQLLSFALAAARSARAALHSLDRLAWCCSRQARMAPLARSTLAQNFWMSAAQAARTFCRASDRSGEDCPPLCASVIAGARERIKAAPRLLRNMFRVLRLLLLSGPLLGVPAGERVAASDPVACDSSETHEGPQMAALRE